MQLQDSTMCLSSLNLLSNMTSAYLSVPSTVMAHQHTNTTLNISSILQTHYILNALFFLLSIGFLSWSLDSHHDVDVVSTTGDVRVQTNISRTPSPTRAPSKSTPVPVSVARPRISARQSHPLSTVSVGPTPNFSARRQTYPGVPSLKMIDSVRERRSLYLPSAASSLTAQSFGIEGTDVLWSIPSIDEVRSLKSLSLSLPLPLPLSPSPSPTSTPRSRKASAPAPAVIVVDAVDKPNTKGEVDMTIVKRDSAPVVEGVLVKKKLANEMEEVVKRAERRSRSWKTRALIRLRIPVQWML